MLTHRHDQQAVFNHQAPARGSPRPGGGERAALRDRASAGGRGERLSRARVRHVPARLHRCLRGRRLRRSAPRRREPGRYSVFPVVRRRESQPRRLRTPRRRDRVRARCRSHARPGEPTHLRPAARCRRRSSIGSGDTTTRTTLRSNMLVDEAAARFGNVVVLDAHTASPRRMGDHEVVIGSRRGETAAPHLVDEVLHQFRVHGLRPERDVPGYSGGYITRRFGCKSRNDSHAIQIEINTSVLMSTTIAEHRERLRLGRPPLPDPEAVERAKTVSGGRRSGGRPGGLEPGRRITLSDSAGRFPDCARRSRRPKARIGECCAFQSD